MSYLWAQIGGGTDSWNKYELEFSKAGCDVVYIEHTDGISSSILRDKI